MIPDEWKRPLFVKLFLARAKDVLDRHPDGYLAVQRFIRRNHEAHVKILSRDTDLVIEGFPRSGCSFAYQTFAADQKRRLKIASHLHYSSHVVKACRMGLPTVVLIRAPRDAIVSVKALSIQSDPSSQAFRAYPMVSFTQWYVHFYERIQDYLPSLVLADFDQVTRDIDQVIGRVNAKFGTNILEFGHTKASETIVFRRSGYHLSPSVQRNLIKKEITHEYLERSNQKWAARAEQLYQSLLMIARGDDQFGEAR